MTQPPYGPQHSDPSLPPPNHLGHGHPPVPPPPAEPAGRGTRARRGPLVGAAAGGVLVLGGAGYAVAAYLSGGGAQPEEVLPVDTLAFVKVDLDPAMNQKTAVAGLMEKFPALGDGTDDLRQDAVDRLLELSDAELDFTEDVEPWLGDRMAAAVVPDEASEQGFAAVLVLAVDDQQAMGDSLGEVRKELGFGYAVRDDFLLLAEDQETADRLAGEDSRLSEDDDYVADLAALDGDQLAVAWADLSALQTAIAAQLPPEAGGSLFDSQSLSGRVILGAHAESDAFEVTGLAFSVSDVGVPGEDPTRLVQDLPEDTLAALSTSGLGDKAVDTWEELESSGVLAGAEEPLAELGLDLPDDLRMIFGTDTVVAAVGDLEQPGFGARVTTEEPRTAARLLDGVLSSPEFGVPAVYSDAEGGYAVATDQATLDALVDGGRLGETEAFQAAVAEPDDASWIGYADLAAVVDQLVEQGGSAGEEAAKWQALEAFGGSQWTADEGTRFVLRITTR